MRPPKLLVLGLGNVLCGDDGLGVVAVERLQSLYRPTRRVRLVDGGTRGLALLPTLELAPAAILLDAVRAPVRRPGEVVRLEGDEIGSGREQAGAPQDLGVAELVTAARLRGKLPDKLVLLGIVPQAVDLGVGLSQAVEHAIPALLEAVLREGAEVGCPFVRRARARPLHDALARPKVRMPPSARSIVP